MIVGKRIAKITENVRILLNKNEYLFQLLLQAWMTYKCKSRTQITPNEGVR